MPGILGLTKFIPKAYLEVPDGLDPEVSHGSISGTEEVNFSDGAAHDLRVGGNVTLTLVNPKEGRAYVLRMTKSSTGSPVVTWPGNVRWPDDTPPDIANMILNDIALVNLYYDGTNYYGSFVENV